MSSTFKESKSYIFIQEMIENLWYEKRWDRHHSFEDK